MAVRIDFARSQEGSGLQSEFTFRTWSQGSTVPSTASHSERSVMNKGSDEAIDDRDTV